MPAARHRQATAAVVDGLMAATAKVRGWTFVTRNVADWPSDVRLLDPFGAASG
jgi:predicted nucleic acid-binding protein